jgi:hypothetical protein
MKSIYGTEEMDENIIAIAMYKIREVPGVSKVERVFMGDCPTPFPMIGFDPIANSGFPLLINDKQVWLSYFEAKDMTHDQFGQQIAANYVKKVL